MTGFAGISVRWLAIAASLCGILIVPVVNEAAEGWLFPDGTSYLDMATSALRESPRVLFRNAYWSPAYPVLLGVMMAVVRPSVTTELRAVYTLNWLVFLATALAFGFLLRVASRSLYRLYWPELASGSAGGALLAFGYALFLLANTNLTLWYITPDMLVQCLTYLSAALAVRLFLPEASWMHSAALGLTLGLGYLAKAAVLPAALLLIVLLFLALPQGFGGRRHGLVALASFIVVAAPLVLSLSLEKHRFTFGDSGKLNYAWFIAGVPPYSGWNGQLTENGTPVHPPRRISESPAVLEFRTPVGGTLPIWYDASYWWEGLRVPLSIRRQLNGLLRPFTQVHSKQTILLTLLAALLAFCLLIPPVRAVICGGGIRVWILIAWPAATCVMYYLVLFNFRYVVAYLVLICLGIATLLLQAIPPATRTRTLLAITLLLLFGVGLRLRPGRLTVAAVEKDTAASSAVAARELGRLGLRPGDEISVIGHSLDCYYARVAGVRIVAQIWEDPEQISGLSTPKVRQVIGELKQIGVKALVSRGKPGFINDDGWQAIPRTDIYVRML